MFFQTQLFLSLGYQLTPNKLVPQEQFYLGGATTVRGYPEGDYLSDQGILFNVDYLVPLPLVPEDWKLPYSEVPLKRQIQLDFFFDEGYGKLRGASEDEPESRNLMGVGAGLRIYLYKNIYARLALAHVIGDEPLTESDHTRFHFSLQTEI
jgi:hemolysin activation/secretion protein